jgi:hypothetical protein
MMGARLRILPSPQISQSEIEHIIRLRNELARIRADLEEAEARLADALRRGLTVEAGAYEARLRRRRAPGRRIEWLEIL